MKSVRAWELGLWDCQRLRSAIDVLAVVEQIADLGLVPGVGAWTREGGTPEPVRNIRAHLDRVHRTTPAGQRVAQGAPISPADDAENWAFAVVRPDQPHIANTLAISRRGGDHWDIFLLVGTSRYTKAGQSLEQFGATWAPFLEHLGNVLYTVARPTLGTFTNTEDEVLGFPSAVAHRQLVVGWRSWFGPSYADAFGAEWLLGLPDWTAALDDGGVAHGLNASPVALAENDPHLYASVWPYLEPAGVEPAWPRPRRARKRVPAQTEADQELTAFRREMAELLSFTMVLAGNQRVKVFGPELAELSQPQRALVLHTIREAVEQDLAAHPEARLRLEVFERPPDLQALLDDLAQRHTRFGYTVLPGTNGH